MVATVRLLPLLAAYMIACLQLQPAYTAGQPCVPETCSSGLAWSAANSSCVPCPAGYYCPGEGRVFACRPGSSNPGTQATAETACQPCTVGTSASLPGAVTCVTCHAGWACPHPALPPTACPMGTYTSGGATECTPCPAAASCFIPAMFPQTCPTGTHSAIGAVTCTPCPAGFHCPTSDRRPLPCIPGTFSMKAASHCSVCPAGEACPSTTDPGQAYLCPGGTFAVEGQTSCTVCRPGYFCPNTTVDTQHICSPGSFSLGAAVACTPCRAGYACPEPDGLANFVCPAGTYSSHSATSCTRCPPGFACPYPQVAQPVACNPGSYSLGGQIVCTPCPPGRFCTRVDSASGGDCVPGSFSAGSQSVCTGCPVGMACPSRTAAIQIPCELGTYSTGLQTSCTACPAGSFCATTTALSRPCPSGTYSQGYQTECTRCPAGHACPKTNRPPQLCAPGTYATTADTTCRACLQGTICAAGATDPNGEPCPAGAYCPTSAAAIPCAPGTYNTLTAQTMAAACLACPAGFECHQPGLGAALTKFTCPPGHYCPLGTGTALPCPAGTLNLEPGARALSSCLSCPAGTYCPAAAVVAVTCPRGYFCPPGAASPQSCGAGFLSKRVGANDAAACQPCPFGHVCPLDTPLPCPAGTFQPHLGQYNLSTCRPCPAGSTCPMLATVEPVHGCVPGYFCPAGSSSATTHPCPAGTFSNLHNASSEYDCQTCPPGFACGTATGGTQTPLRCSAGFICPAGSTIQTQRACAAGTYLNLTGQATIAACLPCPAGSMCAAASTGPTAVCPAGHFCLMGTALHEPIPCPAGSFSSAPGNSRISDCQACPTGAYCGVGTVTPLPCPPTSFRGEEGGGSVLDCLPCPSGYHCPTAGVTAPSPCGRGNYSSESAADCIPCLPGYYCAQPATSAYDMRAQMVCPAGTVCAAGRAVAPDPTLDACPVGHFCLAGRVNAVPQACTLGTYNALRGRTSADDCLSCPPGTACPEAAMSAPVECPAGFYCPPRSTDATAHPCPPTTYSERQGAHSAATCASCVAGTFCPTFNTSHPLVCPLGHYCVEKAAAPTPCPAGTFNAFLERARPGECQQCVPGQYCGQPGLAAPSGLCVAGYLCFAGAQNSTGQAACPEGHYCPAGALAPVPCPPGTFGMTQALTAMEDCQPCLSGFYCALSGTSAPTGSCYAGHYCPTGSRSPTQFATAPGYFARSQSATAEPCAPGTYQPAMRAAACLECQPGFLCDLPNMPVPKLCPAGFYCSANATAPLPCPAGTIGAGPGLQSATQCSSCKAGSYCDSAGLVTPTELCLAGHFCPSGSALSDSPATVCQPGYYCPPGTASDLHFPCPRGTFNPQQGGSNLSACLPCPAGRFCERLAATEHSGLCAAGYFCQYGVDTPTPGPHQAHLGVGGMCPPGHFCVEGTSAPQPCPEGTFANQSRLSVCVECLAGAYCAPAAVYPRPCPAGYFCKAGTSAYWQQPCPRGTLGLHSSLTSAQDCSPCPAGRACTSRGITDTNDPSIKECAAGHWCQFGVDVINPDGLANLGAGGLCPMGFYCPLAAIEPQPCPVATLGLAYGLKAETECSLCPAGSFCAKLNATSSTGLCPAGWYCPPGAATANVTACPAGFSCPAGAVRPEPCPAGWHSLSGSANCSACPPGYACPPETGDLAPYVCPVGHFCPIGTQEGAAMPCPVGTFHNVTGSRDQRACQPCTPGMFCNTHGRSEPNGLCAAGWFCSGGAGSAQPAFFGVENGPDCICPSSGPTGGFCPVGSYCPAGSARPQSCPAGSYCDRHGLAQPSGFCSPGVFCRGGAISPNPTDGVRGGTCPAGHFCPLGSGAPVPCPAGFVSAGLQASNASACAPCPPGSYCESAGQVGASGLCHAGYYCPGGQSSGRPGEFRCPSGHACPTGSTEPTVCVAGSFQSASGASSCTSCPAGFFCDDTQGVPLRNISAFVCPQGHYCPESTRFATEFPCPLGTYNSNIRQENAFTGCVPCPPGQFCDELGLSAPAGECAPGYFCRSGAQSRTPLDTQNGNVCPRGHFCPPGSSEPTACPAGSFGPSSGLTSEASCHLCSGGQACPTAGLTAPSHECAPGFYCLAGAITTSPVDGVTGGVCPVGTACPIGSTLPQPCAPGSYVNISGAATCNPCPARSYCLANQVHPILCPAGHFCPAATGPNPHLCPPGTYSGVAGLSDELECTACDGGHYCSTPGATTPQGNCESGYFCRRGVNTSTPDDGNGAGFTGLGGQCPSGSYCPEQSSAPVPCPKGTYRRQLRARSLQDCLACAGGAYCSETGRSEPAGPCAEGYFCRSDATNVRPIDDETGLYGLCPRGAYCPTGSSAPVPCPAGSFANVTGLPTCWSCPAGYFCPFATVNPEDYPCPQGSYCPKGTQQEHEFRCPVGTFGPVTHSQHLADCQPCTAGFYCAAAGLGEPSAPCAAGWYCPTGANGPREQSCSVGSFCPAGAAAPTPCTAGFYCDRAELPATAGPCEGGFYCTAGSVTSQPNGSATGGVCPAGYYCPTGSSWPRPCPRGTFSAAAGLMDVSQCHPCTPGLFCDETGLVQPKGACLLGHFCAAGSSSAAEVPCPVGHACAEGAFKPIPCSPGTYQLLTAQSTCVSCAAGFFCEGREMPPRLCPAGGYCPLGTTRSDQFPCPVGSYGATPGLANVDNCTECGPGKYCAPAGRSSPAGDCDAGYLCTGGATSPQPGDLSHAGGSCPAGYFCLAGATKATPCPAGTFGGRAGLEAVTQCTACSAGAYCDAVGLTAPTGACFAGFICTGGSPEPSPIDRSYGDECPMHYFCPVGSIAPQPCPPGTYAQITQLASATDCSPCPSGHYCDVAAGTPLAACEAGFFCSGSAWNSRPTDVISGNMCPANHFCPTGSAAPQPCPDGSFTNRTQAATCEACPPGFSCVAGSAPVLCSGGQYCPDRTGSFGQLCPAGTYNPGTGLQTAEQCVACPGGQYCAEAGLVRASGPCHAGYVCVGGVNTPTPLAGAVGLTGQGDLCSLGHFCPAGSSTPQPCPAGSFNDRPGNSVCEECLPGFFCPAGTVNPGQDLICPPGHYCPAGTTSANQYPCPAGTFLPGNGACSMDDCRLCLPGRYCATEGLSSSGEPCAAGWYCTGGASMPTPTMEGNTSTCQPCVCPMGSNDTGGQCPAGSYCPSGSMVPVTCPAGYYCDHPGLAVPTGPCTAGYHCLPSSTSPMAEVCSIGSYCPTGTTVPIPCPSGYYGSRHGLANKTECQPCPAGDYCEGLGLTAPTGPCHMGSYCPAASASPIERVCPAGYFCPARSAEPHLCLAGTHQPFVGQTICIICPQGYFCDPNNAASLVQPVECPVGFYCPTGTQMSTEYPCAPGTMNSWPGAAGPEACRPCYEGTYCGSYGLAEPTGDCWAGFYCPSGSSTPREIECPAGSYCGPRSAIPEPCPRGMFSSQRRLEQVSDCLPCPPGQYCAVSGASNASIAVDCEAGFVCAGGATTSRPIHAAEGFVCPRGHFCPTGAVAAQVCPEHTFGPDEGMTHCSSCPAGYECRPAGTIEPRICEAGWYCPMGQGRLPCPSGTYSVKRALTMAKECRKCDVGAFCPGAGLVSPAGLCAAGYFCAQGATHPTPQTAVARCVNTTDIFLSVNSSRAACEVLPVDLVFLLDASSATADVFSAFVGLTTNLVSWLNLGITDVRLAVATLTAKPALLFDFLQHESSAAAVTDIEGLSHVGKSAPAAQIGAAMSYVAQELLIPSRGHRGGTTVVLLLTTGTNAETLTVFEEKRAELTATGALIHVIGVGEQVLQVRLKEFASADGLVLLLNGVLDLPLAAEMLRSLVLCNQTDVEAGEPMLCKDACPADSTFCTGPCPTGYFCPYGTRAPMPCPAGTVRTQKGARNEGDCSPCPAGAFCAATGASVPSGPCDAGYYCPSRLRSTVAATAGFECPAGNACPAGSSSPVPCMAGTYQPLLGRDQCKRCPAGYYCPISATQPTVCPVQHYCPPGSPAPVLCEPGTVGDQIGLTIDCPLCPAGRFCRDGRVVGPCAAGFFCLSGANTSTPASNTTGSENCAGKFLSECVVSTGEAWPCAPGFYCPAGTEEEVPCPSTTVREELGGRGVHDCVPCPPGSSCGEGTSTPKPCPAGFYCPAGAVAVPCPAGTFRAETGGADMQSCWSCPPGFLCDAVAMTDFETNPCPEGYFCSAGTLAPTPCPPGSYGNATGLQSVHECNVCPGGFICPEKGAVGHQGCPAGFYCPEGTLAAMTCPYGFYCPGLAAAPTPCPSGFFCATGAVQPQICPFAHFCPAQAGRPTLCPAGTTALVGASDLGAAETACQRCPAGTVGVDPDRRQCRPCEAGYYCPFGSGLNATALEVTCPFAPSGSSPNYFCLCPPGHFCPSQSPAPVPCAAGLYNPRRGQISDRSCLSCPTNTFIPQPGSSACRPCGSSAVADPGASTCTCIGTRRTFSPADGICSCDAGFVASRDGPIESNGQQACYPVVLDRCGSSEVLFGDTSCINPADTTAVQLKCQRGCGGVTNVLGIDTFLGICVCKEYIRTSDVCPASCQAAVPSIQCYGEGRFQMQYANGSNETIDRCEGLLGVCDSGSVLTPVSFNGDAIFGLFAERSYFEVVCGQPPRRARRANMTSTGVLAAVAAPAICLELGETLFFELDPDNRLSFPMYFKQHRLNSNPTFDYGAFRLLAEEMRTGTAPVRAFVHQFRTAGLHVFSDASDVTLLLFVAVMPAHQVCPFVGIQPATSSVLVQLGASQTDAVQSPDWPRTAGIVGYTAAAVLIFVLLVASIARYRRHHRVGRRQNGTVGEQGARDGQVVERLPAQTVLQRLENHLQELTDRIGGFTASMTNMYQHLATRTEDLQRDLRQKPHDNRALAETEGLTKTTKIADSQALLLRSVQKALQAVGAAPVQQPTKLSLDQSSSTPELDIPVVALNEHDQGMVNLMVAAQEAGLAQLRQEHDQRQEAHMRDMAATIEARLVAERGKIERLKQIIEREQLGFGAVQEDLRRDITPQRREALSVKRKERLAARLQLVEQKGELVLQRIAEQLELCRQQRLQTFACEMAAVEKAEQLAQMEQVAAFVTDQLQLKEAVVLAAVTPVILPSKWDKTVYGVVQQRLEQQLVASTQQHALRRAMMQDKAMCVLSAQQQQHEEQIMQLYLQRFQFAIETASDLGDVALVARLKTLETTHEDAMRASQDYWALEQQQALQTEALLCKAKMLEDEAAIRAQFAGDFATVVSMLAPNKDAGGAVAQRLLAARNGLHVIGQRIQDQTREWMKKHNQSLPALTVPDHESIEQEVAKSLRAARDQWPSKSSAADQAADRIQETAQMEIGLCRRVEQERAIRTLEVQQQNSIQHRAERQQVYQSYLQQLQAQLDIVTEEMRIQETSPAERPFTVQTADNTQPGVILHRLNRLEQRLRQRQQK